MDISPECGIQSVTDKIIMESKSEKSLGPRGQFALFLSLNDNDVQLI